MLSCFDGTHALNPSGQIAFDFVKRLLGRELLREANFGFVLWLEPAFDRVHRWYQREHDQHENAVICWGWSAHCSV